MLCANEQAGQSGSKYDTLVVHEHNEGCIKIT
jgi:hypothetical protein